MSRRTWTRSPDVRRANFAVAFRRDEQTFDRNALVAAIVELRRRALEL